jgi:hypothetical protein
MSREYKDDDTLWDGQVDGYYVRMTVKLRHMIQAGKIGLNEILFFMYLGERAAPRFIAWPSIKVIKAATGLTEGQQKWSAAKLVTQELLEKIPWSDGAGKTSSTFVLYPRCGTYSDQELMRLRGYGHRHGVRRVVEVPDDLTAETRRAIERISDDVLRYDWPTLQMKLMPIRTVNELTDLTETEGLIALEGLQRIASELVQVATAQLAEEADEWM